MKKALPRRAGTSGLLAALALCALLMSIVFYRHIHHGAIGGPAGRKDDLPGFTVGAAGADLVVTSVQSNGQAAQHGVAVGDKILAVDGQSVHSLDQVRQNLVKGPQDEVAVSLRAEGQMRIVRLSRRQD